MTHPRADKISSEDLVAALCRADAYRNGVDSPIVMHETHVSWVFLAGDFAYKVKKPITTSFLDYGTLARREWFCREELRLDRRYAADLYLDVVPITNDHGGVRVEGAGVPIEFAVKMRRFPDDALLSERLDQGILSVRDVCELAGNVAEFHRDAARATPDDRYGSAGTVLASAMDNFRDLHCFADNNEAAKALETLEQWSTEFFEQHRGLFAQRAENGFIRECHGDLHLQNVILWRGRLTPFDGIEFNDEFRWIDLLSDAAFLAMDFAARGHDDLSHIFINAYLENTGDYNALPVLRWYLVFRALVRAKVALIRAGQTDQHETAQTAAINECRDHIDLASRFAKNGIRFLWITHGLSGSGKTTGSESVVSKYGAIRLRSDVERKRRFGLEATARSDEATMTLIYSHSSSDAVYTELLRLAKVILSAGYGVLVDATFLKQRYRQWFHDLAESEAVEFGILEFKADIATLRRRIALRQSHRRDASDADEDVLESQLESMQPLSDFERKNVVRISGSESGEN